MLIYHGGTDIIKVPQIVESQLGRDFGPAFYCTDILEQAEKWAERQGRIRRKPATLNVYEFDKENALKNLNFKIWNEYSIEWISFVVNNRKNSESHNFDIVFGKIANDDVGETVQAVIDGLTPLDFALQKLTFMKANNQYAFCTKKSLQYIKFLNAEKMA